MACMLNIYVNAACKRVLAIGSFLSYFYELIEGTMKERDEGQ